MDKSDLKLPKRCMQSFENKSNIKGRLPHWTLLVTSDFLNTFFKLTLLLAPHVKIERGSYSAGSIRRI
jgi:hypothetical protein